MRVSFSFLRQLLELLTSDWQDYLNNEIKKLKILSITKTNDGFLRRECFKIISDIRNSIEKYEYPSYIIPFNKAKYASFLLTNNIY
ncbi:hypothetical protein [Rickettsia endosymbiont of Pantilius tunicatus]|uniref:hypothetical protein n=1 Tax=Rickettsia endosymbiont of Pantilius tunicatus TaxID=3066267 RepID=UPI0030E50629